MPHWRVTEMSKGTTHRSFRCDDELWEAAKAEFKARGKNISDEIRGFLRDEVEGGLLASPNAISLARASALREAAPPPE